MIDQPWEIQEGRGPLRLVMPEKMDDLMANYCFDCHDDETKKGEVQLDNWRLWPSKTGWIC